MSTLVNMVKNELVSVYLTKKDISNGMRPSTIYNAKGICPITNAVKRALKKHNWNENYSSNFRCGHKQVTFDYCVSHVYGFSNDLRKTFKFLFDDKAIEFISKFDSGILLEGQRGFHFDMELVDRITRGIDSGYIKLTSDFNTNRRNRWVICPSTYSKWIKENPFVVEENPYINLLSIVTDTEVSPGGNLPDVCYVQSWQTLHQFYMRRFNYVNSISGGRCLDFNPFLMVNTHWGNFRSSHIMRVSSIECTREIKCMEEGAWLDQCMEEGVRYEAGQTILVYEENYNNSGTQFGKVRTILSINTNDDRCIFNFVAEAAEQPESNPVSQPAILYLGTAEEFDRHWNRRYTRIISNPTARLDFNWEEVIDTDFGEFLSASILQVNDVDCSSKEFNMFYSDWLGMFVAADFYTPGRRVLVFDSSTGEYKIRIVRNCFQTYGTLTINFELPAPGSVFFSTAPHTADPISHTYT